MHNLYIKNIKIRIHITYILTYEEFTYYNANGWTWDKNIRYV